MMTTTTQTMQQAIDEAPEGTSGLVIEPWAPGEVYGVAANWAQAACPVYFRGATGWEPRQYQVADFSHQPEAALDCELREVLIASGGDEDEAAELVSDATEF